MPPMNRNLRIALAMLAVSLVVGLSLVLVFNDAVRGFVLDPLVSGINAVRYYLGYVSQTAQWLITLLAVSVIVIGYYFGRLPYPAVPTRMRPIPKFSTQGPAMALAEILGRAGHSMVRRERVILELRDLAVHSLAYRHGVSPDDARVLLDSTEWTSDAAVRAFLSPERRGAGKRAHKGFTDRVNRTLACIERAYQEV
jgi:hypothetical protein